MSNERLQRIKAAAMTDNGLAIQMARYSHEDVLWLIAELAEAEAALEKVQQFGDFWNEWQLESGPKPGVWDHMFAQLGEILLAAGRPTT